MVNMGAYILIITMRVYGGEQVVFQEFDDVDACVAAAQIIKEESYYVSMTYCMPKGTED